MNDSKIAVSSAGIVAAAVILALVVSWTLIDGAVEGEKETVFAASKALLNETSNTHGRRSSAIFPKNPANSRQCSFVERFDTSGFQANRIARAEIMPLLIPTV